jgi:hypothetical protein
MYLDTIYNISYGYQKLCVWKNTKQVYIGMEYKTMCHQILAFTQSHQMQNYTRILTNISFPKRIICKTLPPDSTNPSMRNVLTRHLIGGKNLHKECETCHQTEYSFHPKVTIIFFVFSGYTYYVARHNIYLMHIKVMHLEKKQNECKLGWKENKTKCVIKLWHSLSHTRCKNALGSRETSLFF